MFILALILKNFRGSKKLTIVNQISQIKTYPIPFKGNEDVVFFLRLGSVNIDYKLNFYTPSNCFKN